jgi:hypothetical protein
LGENVTKGLSTHYIFYGLGYLSIHTMASTAVARYNFTTTIVEIASWSKFIDGYVQVLILKFIRIGMWKTW